MSQQEPEFSEFEQQVVAALQPATDEPTPSSEAPPPSPEEPVPPAVEWVAPDFIRGRDERELKHALDLMEWARGLSPEQTRAIDAYLNGEYQFVPASQQSDTEDEPDDDEIAKLRRELDEVRTSQQRTSYEQEQSKVLETVDTVSLQFAQDHNLTEDQLGDIQQQLYDMGTFTALSQRFGVEEGLKRGLDMVYRTTNYYLEAQKESAIQQALLDQQRADQRQRMSTALTPSAGSVPASPPKEPSNKRERRDAMLTDVAKLIASNDT